MAKNKNQLNKSEPPKPEYFSSAVMKGLSVLIGWKLDSDMVKESKNSILFAFDEYFDDYERYDWKEEGTTKQSKKLLKIIKQLNKLQFNENDPKEGLNTEIQEIISSIDPNFYKTTLSIELALEAFSKVDRRGGSTKTADHILYNKLFSIYLNTVHPKKMQRLDYEDVLNDMSEFTALFISAYGMEHPDLGEPKKGEAHRGQLGKLAKAYFPLEKYEKWASEN